MNKQYWNNLYAGKLGNREPSSFALHVLESLPGNSTMLELGCGNGRDAFFFAEHGHQVYAIDQSAVVINRIKGENINPRFHCRDIRSDRKPFPFRVDHGYARFFLHALNKSEADAAIRLMSHVLPDNGLFFSESRSVKSSLYGVGETVEDDIYITDHKRRFIHRDELIQQLELNGFIIDQVVESDGLAVYMDDDPVVIRVTARKAPGS